VFGTLVSMEKVRSFVRPSGVVLGFDCSWDSAVHNDIYKKKIMKGGQKKCCKLKGKKRIND